MKIIIKGIPSWRLAEDRPFWIGVCKNGTVVEPSSSGLMIENPKAKATFLAEVDDPVSVIIETPMPKFMKKEVDDGDTT